MGKYDILGKSRHSSLKVNFFFPKLVAFLERASRHLRVIQLREVTCISTSRSFDEMRSVEKGQNLLIILNYSGYCG